MASLYHEVRREFERNYLRTELERHGWNRKKTAADLGISYRGILYKIEHFQLAPPSEEEALSA